MKIIEKIEIRNFRSIKKIDLDFNSSISIFSGVNSCGKTNILRAMNLFFNNEVGFEKKISISDFYIEKDQPASIISIRVYFNSNASDRIKKQKKVPERFSIKKEYIFRAGFFSQSIKYYNATENQKQYCEDFLVKWIRFHYIPTDRKVFFKRIYNELSEFLGSPYGFRALKSQFNQLKDNFTVIEGSLNTRDFVQLSLSDELRSRLDISSVGYSLPEVHNLLKVLDFVVERKSGIKSFVSTEGDGIKFINLLQILDIFDSRYLKESRTRPYASIWAIDEPENSLEQKNIELFKNELWDKYTQNKQIFLTSHSPEFLLEADQIGRNKFYGFANINGETKEITEKSSVARLPFTEFERQILIDKMGIGMTRTEKIAMNKQIDLLKYEQDKLKEEIIQSKKPILLVEDKYTQIYQIAYLKMNDISFTRDKLEPKFNKECNFSIFPAEGDSPLCGFLRAKNVDIFKHRKVIGLFDFDTAGVTQFKNLKNESYWKVDCQGDEVSGIFKKRNELDCFVALLLPIPEYLSSIAKYKFDTSYVEIENLLPRDFLLDNNFAKEEDLPVPGGVKYIKIIDDKKSDIWEAAIDLSKNDFMNFKALFDKINELFKN